MKITSGTIARTIILILALINQVLSVLGYSLIPIEDEQINEIVTLVCTIASALTAWWKNNSFTKKAILADEYLNGMRSDTYDSN